MAAPAWCLSRPPCLLPLYVSCLEEARVPFIPGAAPHRCLANVPPAFCPTCWGSPSKTEPSCTLSRREAANRKKHIRQAVPAWPIPMSDDDDVASVAGSHLPRGW